jgi:Tol biopolymer transport system component
MQARIRARFPLALALAIAGPLTSGAARPAQLPGPGGIARISLDFQGGEIYTCASPACKNNSHPVTDRLGLFVSWDTDGTNVVQGAPNPSHIRQVYMRNLVPIGGQQPTTVLLSQVGATGPAGNGHSQFAAISANGRFVAFTSYATNLDPDDQNPTPDVYIRNIYRQTNKRLTELPGGVGFNAASRTARISRSGRHVSFTSLATNIPLVVAGCGPPPPSPPWPDIFVTDVGTGVFEWVSVGHGCTAPDDESSTSSLSHDGTLVAFASKAANLLPTPDPNGSIADVFLRIRPQGKTIPISAAPNGRLGGDGNSSRPSLAGGGGYVVFESEATNLVPGDSNAKRDILVHNLVGPQAGLTVRVSVSSAGAEGDGDCSYAAISADGRFVAFSSLSANLVPQTVGASPTLQFYVHDRDFSGNGIFDEPGDLETRILSVNAKGRFANAASGYACSISDDGRTLPFLSEADNLVPGDTNGIGPPGRDIFVRRL